MNLFTGDWKQRLSRSADPAAVAPPAPAEPPMSPAEWLTRRLAFWCRELARQVPSVNEVQEREARELEARNAAALDRIARAVAKTRA